MVNKSNETVFTFSLTEIKDLLLSEVNRQLKENGTQLQYRCMSTIHSTLDVSNESPLFAIIGQEVPLAHVEDEHIRMKDERDALQVLNALTVRYGNRGSRSMYCSRIRGLSSLPESYRERFGVGRETADGKPRIQHMLTRTGGDFSTIVYYVDRENGDIVEYVPMYGLYIIHHCTFDALANTLDGGSSPLIVRGTLSQHDMQMLQREFNWWCDHGKTLDGTYGFTVLYRSKLPDGRYVAEFPEVVAEGEERDRLYVEYHQWRGVERDSIFNYPCSVYNFEQHERITVHQDGSIEVARSVPVSLSSGKADTSRMLFTNGLVAIPRCLWVAAAHRGGWKVHSLGDDKYLPSPAPYLKVYRPGT